MLIPYSTKKKRSIVCKGLSFFNRYTFCACTKELLFGRRVFSVLKRFWRSLQRLGIFIKRTYWILFPFLHKINFFLIRFFFFFLCFLFTELKRHSEWNTMKRLFSFCGRWCQWKLLQFLWKKLPIENNQEDVNKCNNRYAMTGILSVNITIDGELSANPKCITIYRE